ncbi:hypothetical protein GPJ56_008508 [Histomonas meleagridis]|uniref:uncharacterized protein n=1 Tax=Histomonas meleagridis TaxID=135588 RepID=UPI00355ABDC9|nr:hypothetical protein GPJ56_008508 [Histomonas meleagridis]KAH0798352.1 hypothetical protein GO595_008901 [Histomonas meleagridis]
MFFFFLAFSLGINEPNLVVPSQISAQDSCDVCKDTIYELKRIFLDNPTISKAKTKAAAICYEFMDDTENELCNNILENIINIHEMYEDNPTPQICKRYGMCTYSFNSETNDGKSSIKKIAEKIEAKAERRFGKFKHFTPRNESSRKTPHLYKKY